MQILMHVSHRVHCNNFSDAVNFHLVQPLGSAFLFFAPSLQKVCACHCACHWQEVMQDRNLTFVLHFIMAMHIQET